MGWSGLFKVGIKGAGSDSGQQIGSLKMSQDLIYGTFDFSSLKQQSPHELSLPQVREDLGFQKPDQKIREGHVLG